MSAGVCCICENRPVRAPGQRTCKVCHREESNRARSRKRAALRALPPVTSGQLVIPMVDTTVRTAEMPECRKNTTVIARPATSTQRLRKHYTPPAAGRPSYFSGRREEQPCPHTIENISKRKVMETRVSVDRVFMSRDTFDKHIRRRVRCKECGRRWTETETTAATKADYDASVARLQRRTKIIAKWKKRPDRGRRRAA